MKKSDTNEQVLSRRKALGRIGLFATAAYTVPAFATLSMAHASSGVSGASVASVASVASGASMSGASGPSMSGASGPTAATETTGTGPDPATVQATCGVENLDETTTEGATYVQCLFNNGWEGYIAPTL